MTSEKSSARKSALKIFETICQFTKKLDPISKKILKKTAEIESDPMLLKQILSKTLAKEGAEKWPLLHGELSRLGSERWVSDLAQILQKSGL